MADEETLELGGKIELTGFSSVENGQMIVIKKIVGNYAKKFSEIDDSFDGLKLTMKSIHGDASNKFELRALVNIAGGPYNSKLEDRNIFFGIDKVLKNVEMQIGK